MRKLSMFNTISLDGYFTDSNNDMSFAHGAQNDSEWNDYVSGNASGNGVLLFGRVTYQMMASFWPSEAARQSMPSVADGMTRSQKIVFSKTLAEPGWQNVRVIKDDIIGEMRNLKQSEGPDMVILGSGTIVSQFTQAGLIDSYQFIVCPVALGAGRSVFDGTTRRPRFTLGSTRAFKNGNVLLSYESAS